MSFLSRTMFGLTVFALLSSAAFAANENDGRVAMDQKAAERAMRDFTKCVVSSSKREAKASEFLKIPDGDPKQGVLGQEIAVGGCAQPGSQMRFSNDLFSRAVYTALYGKYFKKAVPENLVFESGADYASEYVVTTVPVDPRQIMFRTFADCTVQNDAISAHKFALSEMHSKDEVAALPLVMTAMQSCLSKGSQLRFSRTVLKGLVAESLYKARQKQAAGEAK
jgi:hypothetical protein